MPLILSGLLRPVIFGRSERHRFLFLFSFFERQFKIILPFLQLVVVRADLNGHLKALKDYFFLAKGDFFQVKRGKPESLVFFFPPSCILVEGRFFLLMSSNSNGNTSPLHKNRVEGKVMGPRPAECASNLPALEKSYDSVLCY